MFSALVFAAIIAASFAQRDWTVIQPNLGTIMFGLDVDTSSTGVVGGFSNGIGNMVLQFTDNGESLQPILIGTAQGQPFMPLAVQSAVTNNTVFVGIGYGRSFPAVAYTEDNGATWHASSTHNEYWGFYHSCSKSLNNEAYIAVGDWLRYCTTPPCPYSTGAAVSTDGGNVWALNTNGAWTWDAWARYGSFINASYGFVSGGYWPLASSSSSFDVIVGDAEFDSVMPLSQHVGVRVDGQSVVHSKAIRDTADAAVQARRQDEGYHGFVAVTADGGLTYREVYNTYNDIYLNQIQCLDDLTCFVVGEGGSRGVILKTTNGGVTWREVFETTRSLVALKLVSGTEGWAGGAIYGVQIRAYLVHTIDAGETWTEVDVADLPYSIWDIDAVDAATVYAVAFNTANSALLRY